MQDSISSIKSVVSVHLYHGHNRIIVNNILLSEASLVEVDCACPFKYKISFPFQFHINEEINREDL